MPTSRRRTGEHPTTSDASSAADSPRLRELVAEIAARLRPVCAGMPAEAFDTLVRQAAQATLRWETRTGAIGRDPG